MSGETDLLAGAPIGLLLLVVVLAVLTVAIYLATRKPR
jgi:hypothetical protein